MTIRDAVREAQRRLATLDAAHRKATERLAQATRRRAEVLAAEDAKVANAAASVEAAVSEMAEAVGAELAATLCGLSSSEVRRLAKAHAAGDTATFEPTATTPATRP